ncbi:MAG: hypothetical protein KC543_04715 [Myxococcales bacterium]|nr:hypothetical protein [Myxococcales bacterium]
MTSFWDGDESETVVIHGVDARRETALALLVNIDGDDVWIPKSQIVAGSDVCEAGDSGDLEITAWFAEKEGLDG